MSPKEPLVTMTEAGRRKARVFLQDPNGDEFVLQQAELRMRGLMQDLAATLRLLPGFTEAK
jgi:hypothetical protein